MDLISIEKNYKSMYDVQLSELVKEANTLRPEVIPLLRKELIERGMNEEAAELDNAKDNKGIYDNLSLREIQKIVTERLESGESFDSIKTDLTANGVNMLSLMDSDIQIREDAFHIIETSNHQEAITKLKEEHNLEDVEIAQLVGEAKGRINYWRIVFIISIIYGLIKFLLKVSKLSH